LLIVVAALDPPARFERLSILCFDLLQKTQVPSLIGVS
jgi:hypothetical protein